jgi:hypothetical protein
MNERSPVAVGIGIAYAVLGVLLLLVALDVWRPPLAVVGPVAVVACGLVLVVAGIHRGRPRQPGTSPRP